jgi:hypothetical protein
LLGLRRHPPETVDIVLGSSTARGIGGGHLSTPLDKSTFPGPSSYNVQRGSNGHAVFWFQLGRLPKACTCTILILCLVLRFDRVSHDERRISKQQEDHCFHSCRCGRWAARSEGRHQAMLCVERKSYIGSVGDCPISDWIRRGLTSCQNNSDQTEMEQAYNSAQM